MTFHCMDIPSCIHPLVYERNILIVSCFGQLQIKLLQTFTWRFLCTHMFSNQFGKHPETQLLNSMVRLYLDLKETDKRSLPVAMVSNPHQQWMRGSVFLHPNTCTCVLKMSPPLCDFSPSLNIIFQRTEVFNLNKSATYTFFLLWIVFLIFIYQFTKIMFKIS